MGAAARAGVNVEFRATGVESVRNGLRLVRSESRSAGEAAEGFGHGAARSIGEFTRGLGNLASQGKVTTLSMREITGSLFGLTSMLGPGGILIPILASVGFAIYEVFNRTRTEIEATRRKAEQELAALQRSANLQGLAALAQRRFSGDPYAVQGEYDEKESDAAFRARQLGQQGMEREIATKKEQIAINDRLIQSMRSVVVQQTRDNDPAAANTARSIALLAQRNHEYQASIDLLSPYLAQYAKHAKDASTAFANAAKEEGERTKNVVAEQQRQFIEGMKTKELQPTLNNQFANDLFGVLLRPPRPEDVANMGQQSIQSLLDGMNLAAQRGIANLNPKSPTVMDAYTKKILDEADAKKAALARGIGETFGRAIQDGLSAAFAKGGNVQDGFKALLADILDGFADMFAQIAENALIGSQIMQKIVDALSSLNPWAAAAAALTLMAFSSSIRSHGRSSGAGSYGGYTGSVGGSSLPPIVSTHGITAASGSVAAASRVTPLSMAPITLFVIGENDPKAGQAIIRLIENAKRRG